MGSRGCELEESMESVMNEGWGGEHSMLLGSTGDNTRHCRAPHGERVGRHDPEEEKNRGVFGACVRGASVRVGLA